jgi:septal ring factor EnvC (AmiA/AmiB activator)
LSRAEDALKESQDQQVQLAAATKLVLESEAKVEERLAASNARVKQLQRQLKEAKVGFAARPCAQRADDLILNVF